MILDNDEADERLASPDNVVRAFRNGAGPRLGKERATKETRDTAVALHQMGVPHQEIADRLGVNYQQSANYAHNNKVGKSKLKLDPSEAMDDVRQAALNKLMCAMGLITEEKLSKLKAPALAGVASKMSAIIERTMPKEEHNENKVTLVVYAPQVKEESSFKVVEI